MKKLLYVFLSAILLITATLSCFSASADSGSSVNIGISCDSDCYVGGQATVKITVSKPACALAGIEFVLNYDSEYVTPLVTENSEEGREMDVLVTKRPLGWEQMSIHYENRGYRFRFAADEVQNSFLDEEGELVLEIPFAVKKAGSFDFTVTDGDIIAASADVTNSLLTGKGGSITLFAVNEAQKLQAELFGDPSANERGAYELGIKITNLGDAAGIIAFELKLEYNKSVFSPTITKNDDLQMNAFMKDMPLDKWEQMCSLDEANGRYTLRFAANISDSGKEAARLLSGEAFILTVPFKVIAAEGKLGSFAVGSGTIIGLNSINGIVTGSGSNLSVSIEKRAEGVTPEELGYTVDNGVLCYLPEKLDAKEFLSELAGYTLTDKNGNERDGYVCTGDILTDGVNSYSVAVLGDINESGIIDTYDYILSARIYFDTFVPSAAQSLAADVTGDGALDQYDYLLIERHYFNTYTIKVKQ